MADRWTLVTPDGELTLNPSFSAPYLHAGGVDANAVLRRDGRTEYQRSGDGLRTPGPLILRGRVWRDDHLIPAIIAELEDIQDAVTGTIQVKRENQAGTYVYGDLAGGPPPVVTPDGLGGWEVEIELWPGRPEPTFIRDGDVDTLIRGSRIVFGLGFVNSVQAGWQFTVGTSAVQASGARLVLYQGGFTPGEETIRLWRVSDGTLVATTTVSPEAPLEWYHASFSSAVTLNAGESYRLTTRRTDGGNRGIVSESIANIDLHPAVTFDGNISIPGDGFPTSTQSPTHANGLVDLIGVI